MYVDQVDAAGRDTCINQKGANADRAVKAKVWPLQIDVHDWRIGSWRRKVTYKPVDQATNLFRIIYDLCPDILHDDDQCSQIREVELMQMSFVILRIYVDFLKH